MSETRAQTLAALNERLGADHLAELLTRGAAMTDDEAVAYANAQLKAIEAIRSLDTSG